MVFKTGSRSKGFDPVSVWREVYEQSARGSTWLDAHRWGYSQEVGRSTIEDIRAKLAPEPGDRILEVGCGSGYICGSLLTQDQRGFGFDLSPGLLRNARRLGVRRERLSLAASEAAWLPARDAAFDRVYCYSVFQCFPSARYASRVLREMLRVCRPGGTVLVGDILPRRSYGPILGAMAGVAARLRAVRRRLRLIVRGRRGALGCSGRVEDLVQRLYYTREFFAGLLGREGHEFEFLEQRIPGREKLRHRFDVRIQKRPSW